MIMLDDLISISECGHQTAMVNSYIKLKTATKKLQFGTEKCKKMHIGKTKEEYKCQNLFIDKWEEKEMESCDSKTSRLWTHMKGRKLWKRKKVRDI